MFWLCLSGRKEEELSSWTWGPRPTLRWVRICSIFLPIRQNYLFDKCSHLHFLPQAKGLTKSGLKSLLMHKVSDHSSSMNATNGKNITLRLNAEPPWGAQPSEGRLHVPPPRPVRLSAKPPAHHAALWEGEAATVGALFIQNLNHSTDACSPQLNCNASCSVYFSPVFLFVYLFFSPCRPQCFVAPYIQSRPRRPAQKQRADRDERDIQDTGEPWSGWELSIHPSISLLPSALTVADGCQSLVKMSRKQPLTFLWRLVWTPLSVV